jgi:hypothetical protein
MLFTSSCGKFISNVKLKLLNNLEIRLNNIRTALFFIIILQEKPGNEDENLVRRKFPLYV